ncbi:MAG TPA: hypothetical protein VEW28_04980 [Candidatus Kapabacteria bacterium]|nr:hypothetical protein [Candidatus Kapabacteria bacterium]
MTKMDTFRKICATTIAVAMTSAALAQPPTRWKDLTADQKVDRRVEMMKKRLAISDAQAVQISNVLHQEQKTLATDREQVKSAPAEQKMLARTNLQKDRLAGKEKVLTALTPDQLAKAEEIRKRHVQKMREYRMFMHHERFDQR